jgi:hypothetical protein
VVEETPGGREIWEEELVGQAGGAEMQQQEELAGRYKELGRAALGDQQNLVEVDDTDDPMDKEATEALPATQLEIDRHRLRLRGTRTQRLAGQQTKITQYQVVWGEHPNRSNSWINEDDYMPRKPSLTIKYTAQPLKTPPPNHSCSQPNLNSAPTPYTM